MATVQAAALNALKYLALLGGLGLLGCLATILIATEFFASRGLSRTEPNQADVIIVLSAGLNRESALDPFSQARVETGVELWRAGVAPALLMSGGYDRDLQIHLAESMKLHALSLGAPESAIYVEGNSISTFENARFTLSVAAQEGWRRAIVVTDDYHLLRAWTLFEFWRKPSDIEIVSLAPANGRGRVGAGRQLLMFGRETLAYPFNILKMIAQIALESFGRGDDRTIR